MAARVIIIITLNVTPIAATAISPYFEITLFAVICATLISIEPKDDGIPIDIVFEKYLFFYYNTRICVKRIGLDKRLQQIRTGLTKHNDLCYRLFRQRRLAGVLPGAFLC